MPLPTLRHAYHSPACLDTGDPTPDERAVKCVGQIYGELDTHAAGFRRPNKPVLTTTYPDLPHVDAPNQVPIRDIFDEERAERLGQGRRNLYLLHRHWRFVLQVTTTTTAAMALQNVDILRPEFRAKYREYKAENPWSVLDDISIHHVWSFFTLLFDFVLESISNKLIGGEVTTKSAEQHAEQLLLRLGSGVAPLISFYADICLSDLFNVLVGRRLGGPAPRTCLFQSLEEILSDPGGRYVFRTVKEFIVCASAAIYDFVELETPKAFENYELCGLRFPTAFMRNITPWSELHDLAFSPFINGLFLNDSMEVDMNKLRPHEFKIITLSRLRLFCCAATRNLTNGVFNFLSYDTVAHGHWKLHNHLDLPAECLGFASTVLLFQLHAVRSGFRAGQMHPVVDPKFCMRSNEGELTATFKGTWRANVASITELSTYSLEGISALERAAVPLTSAMVLAGSRSPESSHSSPAQPSAISRTKSMLNTTFGYITGTSPRATGSNSDLTLSPAGQSGPGSLSASPSASPGPSGPFRPSGSAPSAAAATSPRPGPVTPGRSAESQAQSPIAAALQELAASCRLHERYWPELSNLEDERFPLLKGPVSRKTERLIQMSLREAASGNLGGQLQSDSDSDSDSESE